jgi:hypothetical protein
MANQTRQQVADQLNKLNSQGASEQQIVDYVNSAGFKPDDFNVDLSGSFRPMVIGTGTVTQNYTAAEATESQQYYENLAASSSTITPAPSANIVATSGSSKITTVTTTQVTSFQQTTGGGTTTVYSTPSTPTAASEAYKTQADQAFTLAESYRLNPNSKFGKSALDRRLSEGKITQEQYNEIVNSTPEQRIAQSTAYSTQYEEARTKEVASQAGGVPVVEVTPAQNTSLVNVDYQKTTTTSSTKLTGAVAGTTITTETIDGVTYQVTKDANGATTSYTSPDGTTINVETPVEKATPEIEPTSGVLRAPYNETGQLNPGWEEDELGNPYYVGTDMVPKSAPESVPNGPSTGTPYDDEGNLNPGWGIGDNGDPVWVEAGYVDSTGEVIGKQQTVPDGPSTGTPYDDEGNLNPGWGLDENGDPVWVEAGYVDSTGETIQPQKTIPNNSIQGPPYDDEGNLMPGWSLDEDNNPVWVGNNADGSVFVEPATVASADESRGASQGLTTAKSNTNSQATTQDVTNAKQKEDWRVRLSLASSANYLYKVPKGSAGILEPLQATDGVIFPYTPQIQVQYNANYDPTDLTHSNYKIFQYRNSGVDSFSITCDFTAQDTYEANYILAVIHFFRSVTKMFYGQDQNPKPGTPPPLCYLTGLGAFQFDNHPLAITSFNYSLPADVDYIRAGAVTAGAGVNRSASNVVNNSPNASATRLGPNMMVGGVQPAPIFSTPPGTVDPTYVPTKIQMTIGAVPIVTRNDISNRFSLKDYATGSLLRGSRHQGGGIW